MVQHTKIEWADHTMNFWEGCQPAGPGCDHCYAEMRNKRFGGGVAPNWGPGAPRRRTSTATWSMPARWNDHAKAFQAKFGRRQRVFALSLGDWLDNQVPIEWLVDMLDIVRTTTGLDWLLLTKRVGNWQSRMKEAIAWLEGHRPDSELVTWLNNWLDNQPPRNVHIGATICNQEEANRDIPKLLKIPAVWRFLSMEPLLGPVDLTRIPVSGSGHHEFDPITTANVLQRAQAYPALPKVHQVIVGGESGPDARPMHPDWVRSLRDQAASAGAAFMFKQWGEWGTAALNLSTGLPVFRQFPDHQTWVNKAPTWVCGGICLDKDGQQLNNGVAFAKARDDGKFPVTVMHKLGKAKSGRLLDGRTHD